MHSLLSFDAYQKSKWLPRIRAAAQRGRADFLGCELLVLLKLESLRCSVIDVGNAAAKHMLKVCIACEPKMSTGGRRNLAGEVH